MPIEDDLSDFFANSQRLNNVIKNPEKFRSQLQIGSDAFKYLSNAGNIGNFTQIIGAGALAGTTTSIVSTASLGALGQIGLAVGVVSTPVGWIALAGAASILTTYGAKRLFSSAKNEMVTEIPNFINTPLDVIGASICELILPILLKISYADGNFSENERITIEGYFINKWGFDDLYIKKIIKDIETNIDSFSFDNLAAELKEIESTGDCKFDTMSKEILSISNEVLMSDGASHKNEIIEIKKLEKALSAVNCETKFDKRIIIQSTKDLGVKAIDSVKTSGSWIQKHISKINQKK